MLDACTLTECGISDGDMLSLVYRLRGGIKILIKTLSGQKITMPVELSDSISDIMAEVQKVEGE